MSHFSSRLFRVFALCICVALISSCAPRAMRGGAGTANPNLDAPAMSTTLDKTDIDYLVGETLEPMLSSRFWAGEIRAAHEQPLVAIWPIENKTSYHIDDQLLTLLSSVETTLVNSGDVRVVNRQRQSELAREIGIQQGAAFDPASARSIGRQMGVQYFVTGKVTSVEEKIQKTRRVQYMLFIQVLEIETGLIKFQNESARSKALKR
jgi:PBP1b-binding outer membrane lipoprotein LpoB